MTMNFPRFLINDRLLKKGVYNAAVQNDQPEKVISIRHKGIMEVVSEIGRDKALLLKRSFFPSIDKAMAIEKLVFINTSNKPQKVEMEYLKKETSPGATRTKEGPHFFIVSAVNPGEKTIQPGDSTIFVISYQATRGSQQPLVADVSKEEAARKDRINNIVVVIKIRNTRSCIEYTI